MTWTSVRIKIVFDAVVFVDGFETGDVSGWSSSGP